jgi:uncharacterized protein (TIGR00730 family)
MPTIEELRRKIQRNVNRYLTLEEQLGALERERFRVCIFGSARIRPEDPTYQLVYQTAKMLTEKHIDVVTGGGPGLMEAANRGVIEVEGRRSQSIGLPIQLPRSQELANTHLDIKSEHRRFSSRLDEFMWLSDAVIVAPGGIGTLLELVYVWQLLQVGMIESRPVVLLGRKMWDGLLAWMREEMLGRKLVGPNDFQWVHGAETPEEAFGYIEPVFEAYLKTIPPSVAEVTQAVGDDAVTQSGITPES